MIPLSEIFEHLTYSELAHVHIGGASQGGIQTVDYPQIITYINMAMVELYKRFPIKLATLDIQLTTGLERYPLRVDFASTSASAEPIKFILDSVANPFTGDVLQIERISNIDLVDIPINRLNNTLSVFTPEFDIITISDPDPTDVYTVEYRAYPVKLSRYIDDPTTTTINLPDQLTEALLSYVAHRAFAGLPTPEPVNSASYYTKFLAAVRTVNELGLVNKMETENTRLDANGFI